MRAAIGAPRWDNPAPRPGRIFRHRQFLQAGLDRGRHGRRQLAGSVRSWLLGLEGDPRLPRQRPPIRRVDDFAVTVGVKTGGYATARRPVRLPDRSFVALSDRRRRVSCRSRTPSAAARTASAAAPLSALSLSAHADRLDRRRRHRKQDQPELEPEDRVSLRRRRQHELRRQPLRRPAERSVPAPVSRHQVRHQLQVRRAGRANSVLRRPDAANRPQLGRALCRRECRRRPYYVECFRRCCPASASRT